MKEAHGQFITINWEVDSDVEFVKGHVTIDEAKEAVRRYSGDFGPTVHGIQHKFARWTPAAHYSDYDMIFNVFDDKGKGTFPVTELDVRSRAPA